MASYLFGAKPLSEPMLPYCQLDPMGHISMKFYLKITMTSQWVQWHLKSPASPLFTQPFIRAQIKENIKATRHWPLCWGEFTGDRWIPRTNGQWHGKCFHLMTSLWFPSFHSIKCTWKCRLWNGGHLSLPQCVKCCSQGIDKGDHLTPVIEHTCIWCLQGKNENVINALLFNQ